MLVLNLPAFENKKYTAYDRFHGNGPCGEIPTRKEPIRTLGFALPYNKSCYLHVWRYHVFARKLTLYTAGQYDLSAAYVTSLLIYETNKTKPG